MYFPQLGAIALSFSLVNAFKDTSPFFLFSTSKLLAISPNLVSADSLRKLVIPHLTECRSDTYVIVSQPGVEAADFADEYTAPRLREKMNGDDMSIRSSFSVTDVLGLISGDELSKVIQDRCEASHLRVDASTGSFDIAEDSKPRVIHVDFPALPRGAVRSQRLLEHDAFLASMLDMIASKKYTVVYTTSPASAAHHTEPADSEAYEMDSQFQAHLHTDLKRDLSHQKRAFDGNITLVDGPLFERYQYLTPGVTGVASLQVSYAAFDKEMGPSAQKNKAQ
ncbi:hypothetical protein P7C71_g2705, partial [Lecanoromycetidae sp. Uapishka_2]